jgi:hypothetical protein
MYTCHVNLVQCMYVCTYVDVQHTLYVQNFPYATHLTLASWKPSHWSPRPRSVDQDLRLRIRMAILNALGDIYTSVTY